MKRVNEIGPSLFYRPSDQSSQLFRQDLYKNGGLMSVTSRILVVDMLQSDMPTELITGIIVVHAER